MTEQLSKLEGLAGELVHCCFFERFYTKSGASYQSALNLAGLYRRLHKVSHPLDRFSKLAYSTTKRMTRLIYTSFWESSRRDGSDAAIFGTITAFPGEISTFTRLVQGVWYLTQCNLR
ncbi:unnamed protein product [Ectocarpus sp. 6 AP-2014]